MGIAGCVSRILAAGVDVGLDDIEDLRSLVFAETGALVVTL